jgi:hypothetical protein
MLAARVEPKNGTWKRIKKPAGQICKAYALASVLPNRAVRFCPITDCAASPISACHNGSSLRTQWVH